MIYYLHAEIAEMGVRRGIDRKKVGCRSLIDAFLEGQVRVNKFKLYFIFSGNKTLTFLYTCINLINLIKFL